MKTFGNDIYKGYVILKDKKGNKTKHFISAVDPSLSNNKNSVLLSVRNGNGDLSFDYKLGTSENVDIAIKTWSRERKKANKSIGNHFQWFYDFLKNKTKTKQSSVSNNNIKKFTFQAFNDNADIFNVISYGVDRKDAYSRAKKILKKDPSIKSWDVTITNAPGDFENFFRNVEIKQNGKIFDSLPYKKY